MMHFKLVTLTRVWKKAHTTECAYLSSHFSDEGYTWLKRWEHNRAILADLRHRPDAHRYLSDHTKNPWRRDRCVCAQQAVTITGVFYTNLQETCTTQSKCYTNEFNCSL